MYSQRFLAEEGVDALSEVALIEEGFLPWFVDRVWLEDAEIRKETIDITC